MKGFDEMLYENGYAVPQPACKPVYADIDVEIRKIKQEINDIDWDGLEISKNIMHNKRTWLKYLLGEKKRGMTKMVIGIQMVERLEHKKS